MKCPKCSYTSFDYLKKCKKCGELLEDSRKALNLKMGEPTFFAGLEDEALEDGKSETGKTETESTQTFEVSSSASAKKDFSPLLSNQPPVSSVPEKQPVEELSGGVFSELGTLGSMNGMESRSNQKEALENGPKIELESNTDTTDSFELTPSFSADNDGTEEPPAGEENQKTEFNLLTDDDKLELDEPLENDIPFEFSASDLESDIDLKVSSENPDKDFIELELDMNDEESLDQILADLEPKK
ncbi:MAG: hypothetical protein KAI69_03145 [Deltaproteobacteria bacterium]|nr:hypothetical protein [Deltaproteobacteria bacterium]